ncbi:MAG: MFS transporter [Chloroflexi bacterium]|nr:MAG: MFS transporter [Chloroflexota bacterium]
MTATPLPLTAPRRSLSRRLLGEEGHPVLPVVSLFLIVFLAYADLSASGVLAPDIRDTFHLNDGQILLIGGGAGFLATCAALPLGYAGDRISRIDIVVVLALVLGLATVGSALAPAIVLFVIARLFTGVGEVSNLPIQQSLLADWYPQRMRPRAFAMHRIGQPAGLVLGALIAGGVAQVSNWRVAFVVVGMPSFAFAYVAGMLRDPARGAHEGLAHVRGQPVRLSAAMRRLWLNRTLRRVWIASFIIGGAYIPLLTLFPLFYKDVYGMGDFQRGVAATLSGIALLLGLLAGGVLGQRLSGRTVRGQLYYAGASITTASLAVVAAAIAHTAAMSVTAAVVSSFLGGIYYAPFTQVLALVSPPRIRSTGLAGAEFALGLGTLVGTALIGSIATAHGDRTALATAGALLAFGGLIIGSAMTSAFEDAVAAARELAVQTRRRSPEEGATPALEVVGIEFAYEGNQVLFGASLEVQPGETVGLLGTNGAGKSTVLKVVAGILQPHRGGVFHAGVDITGMPPEEVARRGIVLMPGGRAVFANLSVRENLRLATWLYRREREASHAAIDEALELFPKLQARIDQPAALLSGGERQMLGVAQALVCRPQLLLLDELTLGLSPRIVEELIGVVADLRKRGLTLVVVEQSVNIAALLCERAYFMEKGRVRFSGAPQDLLRRPDLVRSVFLGAVTAT